MSGSYSSDRLRGARPVGSPTDDCCFDAVGDRVFGRFVCVGGVHGLKMVVSLPRHRVFGGESVCRRGVGCGTRGV